MGSIIAGCSVERVRPIPIGTESTPDRRRSVICGVRLLAAPHFSGTQDTGRWRPYRGANVMRRLATCNHIGYTNRRGDQGLSTPRTRTVLRHWSEAWNTRETRRPAPAHPRPPERLNQRSRYELARLGSPRTPRLPKGHVGREGERQPARHVHFCREGHRSRRLRGLSLR
jgi:hypothetical protein